jgi:hypothetical protein
LPPSPRPHQTPTHHGLEPAAANPAHSYVPRDGPQRPAADPLHHQTVIARIRSTCQGAATKPHGDASYTSRRLRSGPARDSRWNARCGLPAAPGQPGARAGPCTAWPASRATLCSGQCRCPRSDDSPTMLQAAALKRDMPLRALMQIATRREHRFALSQAPDSQRRGDRRHKGTFWRVANNNPLTTDTHGFGARDWEGAAALTLSDRPRIWHGRTPLPEWQSDR